MARCKFCGVEGLVWEEFVYGWDLMEPEGEYHQCKREDKEKEFHRVIEEKAKTVEATRRYREANGYL